MEKPIPPNIILSDEEQKEVAAGFEQIREVLKRKEINIEHVIALVPAEEERGTAEQVKIRFAEVASPRMNMIAFD